MTQKSYCSCAGLAGSECALQLASRGVSVELIEQRPIFLLQHITQICLLSWSVPTLEVN